MLIMRAGFGICLLLGASSAESEVSRALHPRMAPRPTASPWTPAPSVTAPPTPAFVPPAFLGCCADNATSCSDTACLAAVSNFDSFCSATSWDTVCSHWARSFSACSTSCGDLPVLCDPVAQPKFASTIPVPTRLGTPAPGTFLNFYFGAVDQSLGLNYCMNGGIPLTNSVVNTRVFGYGYDKGATGTEVISAPGPTVEASSGLPIDVLYVNQIAQRHVLYPWTKTGYHSAEFQECSASNRRYQQINNPPNYNQLGVAGCVPTVAHLHGGFSRSNYDGLPDSGFLRKDLSVLYNYENNQPGGSTIWIHDHTLGITSLNVAAGMASFYLIRDQNEWRKFAPNNSCGVTQYTASDPFKGCELEIVLSNRNFDAAGNLVRYIDPVTGKPMPAVPEFFGDWSLVNGKVWPVMPVAKSWYRLRLLNGADSNIMALQLLAKCTPTDVGTVVPFLVIGRDQGFINVATTVGTAGAVPLTPLQISALPLADQVNLYRTQYLNLETGSRADVLVDLSKYADTCDFTLYNVGGTPFNINDPFGVMPDPVNNIPAGGIPGVTRPNPDTNGQFLKMKFIPGASSRVRGLPAQFTGTYFSGCATPTKPPVMPTKHRSLFLSEHIELADGIARLQVVLGAAVNTANYDSTPTDLTTARLLPTLQWCRDNLQQEYFNGAANVNPLTERPILNTQEAWVLYNISPDTHHIHLHQVAFSVIKRCPLALPTVALADCFAADLTPEAAVLCSNTNAEIRAKAAITTDLNSPLCVASDSQETAGVRDLVQAWNGYATVLNVPWKKAGQYVWHCHILSHEDNEMMAPVCVLPFDGANSRTICPDYYEACGYNDFRQSGKSSVPYFYGGDAI